MSPSGSQLVLFDIDGTLVPRPGCEPRLARYLLKRGHLGPRQIVAFLYFWLRYLPVHGRDTPQKNKAWLAGLEVAAVREWSAVFVRDVLVAAVCPPVRARLDAHVGAGDHVVLLSGTPDFIAGPLAVQLGAHAGYGSRCATRHGRYLAAPPVAHPHGATKVDAARRVAAQAGLPLGQAVAYGDSANDTQLFRAVARSVAVMPDRRLREAAAGEDWEIMMP